MSRGRIRCKACRLGPSCPWNQKVTTVDQKPATRRGGRLKGETHPILTASCIVSRKIALVGCVMYTFPFPSLKFVYQQEHAHRISGNPAARCLTGAANLFRDIWQTGCMIHMKAITNTNQLT